MMVAFSFIYVYFQGSLCLNFSMTKRDAIQFYGSSAALARALGITRGAVANWGDTIPSGRQFEIEVLTDGALIAERPHQTREQQQGSKAA